MDKFEAGQVVMLRSGGPYMTISAVAKAAGAGVVAGDLACLWFDGPTLYKDTFHPSVVKSVHESVATPDDLERAGHSA
jgi:uncharacterized protein YodC (DUF2158 family)